MSLEIDCLLEKSANAFFRFAVAAGELSAEVAARARAAVRNSELPFDVTFTELGILSEVQLCSLLNRYLKIGAPSTLRPTACIEAVEMIGLDYLKDQMILPMMMTSDKCHLGVADPFNFPPIEAIGYHIDRKPSITVHTRSELAACIKGLEKYDEPQPVVASWAEGEALAEDLVRLRDISLEAPVVSFVARIIQQAVDQEISDIHIEPLSDRLQIRFRRDGILEIFDNVNLGLAAGVITRIKILGKLNIVERRLPQDGRMRMAIRGEEIDFRVSVTPCAHGETIVLRILKNTNVSLDLKELGFDKVACTTIQRLTGHSNGILALTGPTGSGKTTSLYALVSCLDKQRLKIFTVEDPVEYRIDGITQLQVNTTIGLDFAAALRSVLRQDPDVILVGEIRDRETARIAVQAALTGHLVLTTLHTNSAIGAITRLMDLGIEPYLLAATFRGAIAQRLVRKLCTFCKGNGEIETGGICGHCKGSAYAGRTVTYEIFEVGPALSHMINKGLAEDELQSAAVEAGMNTLRENSQILLATGVTSESEIYRVITGALPL